MTMVESMAACPFVVAAPRDKLDSVKRPSTSTAPTAITPVLSDDQRNERLRLLADRLRRPNGLDRQTLERLEQLTDDEQ